MSGTALPAPTRRGTRMGDVLACQLRVIGALLLRELGTRFGRDNETCARIALDGGSWL